MSILSDVAAKIEAFAAEAVAAGEAAAKELAREAVEVAEEVAKNVEPVAMTALHELVNELGSIAVSLVYSIASMDLSGSEKANLSATSLVQAAANKGIALVAADASALIKNAWTATEEAISAKIGG